MMSAAIPRGRGRRQSVSDAGDSDEETTVRIVRRSRSRSVARTGSISRSNSEAPRGRRESRSSSRSPSPANSSCVGSSFAGSSLGSSASFAGPSSCAGGMSSFDSSATLNAEDYMKPTSNNRGGNYNNSSNEYYNNNMGANSGIQKAAQNSSGMAMGMPMRATDNRGNGMMGGSNDNNMSNNSNFTNNMTGGYGGNNAMGNSTPVPTMLRGQEPVNLDQGSQLSAAVQEFLAGSRSARRVSSRTRKKISSAPPSRPGTPSPPRKREEAPPKDAPSDSETEATQKRLRPSTLQRSRANSESEASPPRADEKSATVKKKKKKKGTKGRSRSVSKTRVESEDDSQREISPKRTKELPPVKKPAASGGRADKRSPSRGRERSLTRSPSRTPSPKRKTNGKKMDARSDSSVSPPPSKKKLASAKGSRRVSPKKNESPLRKKESPPLKDVKKSSSRKPSPKREASRSRRSRSGSGDRKKTTTRSRSRPPSGSPPRKASPSRSRSRDLRRDQDSRRSRSMSRGVMDSMSDSSYMPKSRVRTSSVPATKDRQKKKDDDKNSSRGKDNMKMEKDQGGKKNRSPTRSVSRSRSRSLSQRQDERRKYSPSRSLSQAQQKDRKMNRSPSRSRNMSMTHSPSRGGRRERSSSAAPGRKDRTYSPANSLSPSRSPRRKTKGKYQQLDEDFPKEGKKISSQRPSSKKPESVRSRSPVKSQRPSSKKQKSPSPPSRRQKPKLKMEDVMVPSKRIFIEHLKPETKRREVKAAFKKFGSIVELDMPTQRGKSNGFAYITYRTPESAKEAISNMNSKRLEGVRINVAPAMDDGDGGSSFQPEEDDDYSKTSCFCCKQGPFRCLPAWLQFFFYAPFQGRSWKIVFYLILSFLPLGLAGFIAVAVALLPGVITFALFAFGLVFLAPLWYSLRFFAFFDCKLANYFLGSRLESIMTPAPQSATCAGRIVHGCNGTSWRVAAYFGIVKPFVALISFVAVVGGFGASVVGMFLWAIELKVDLTATIANTPFIQFLKTAAGQVAAGVGGFVLIFIAFQVFYLLSLVSLALTRIVGREKQVDEKTVGLLLSESTTFRDGPELDSVLPSRKKMYDDTYER